MTAFDYHYRQWHKRIIEEYLQQTSDGRFDPEGFVTWMKMQVSMGNVPAFPKADGCGPDETKLAVGSPSGVASTAIQKPPTLLRLVGGRDCSEGLRQDD